MAGAAVVVTAEDVVVEMEEAVEEMAGVERLMLFNCATPIPIIVRVL